MSTLEPTVPVQKYHGTGNDFIVVDATAEAVPARPAFAAAHCDRDTGIDGGDGDGDGGSARGADGVLFLAVEDRYSPTRVVMTLVQPDGSVAAMCGNGARVAAKWAAERTGGSEFMIDTPSGTRRATVHGREVTIEMGVPSFDPRDVPLARDGELVEESVAGLAVTAVDTGVPHAVHFAADVDALDIESVAPPVRRADVFPRGANVTLAARDSESGFRQRTFERGVEGETRSCGTGAVAVVAAAKRLGLADGDDPVSVRPPGGALEITVPDDGPATLRGPVVHEFDAELAVAPDREPPVDGA